MTSTTTAGVRHDVATLPWTGARALAIQAALLFAAAFVLPAAMHRAGLPVRMLLPMHWPVLLAGLVYGWRSGFLVGAAAPLLSYLLSGWPLPAVQPAMTAELATYGCLAGWLVEARGWKRGAATAGAVLGGRAIFLVAAGATGVFHGAFAAYLRTAMAPGLAAAVLQIALLPPLARLWVERQESGPGPARREGVHR